MAIIAEYLTTEYTRSTSRPGRSGLLIQRNQRLGAYAMIGTPLYQEWHKRIPHQIGEKTCYDPRHANRVETKARPMTTPPFEDRAPADDCITAYDERHFVTYLRILDAAEESADWREVAGVVFGLDAAIEPDRARLVHDSHLARARWMTGQGYRHLLDKTREA